MIGNGPRQQTVLRLQARKSFAVGLWVTDRTGKPLDISQTEIRFVMSRNEDIGSGTPLVSKDARLMASGLGFARIELQASDLNFRPGEYYYSIVMSDEGFSTTIVQGVVALEANSDNSALEDVFNPLTAISTALSIALSEGNTITVQTGPTLAPGEALFTHELEMKLLQIFAGQASVGGLTADGIPDGTSKVIMTVAERNKLANLQLQWSAILGKPDFGDAALLNLNEILQPGGVAGADITSGQISSARLPMVSGHQGFSHGTGVPTGGPVGGIYFRYSE
jgi:hypothetical protein